jgi:mRNA interferase RelE/StbE
VAEYAVCVARSARRELEALDGATARSILARIEALVQQPRPHGCTKIHGARDLWRVRVGDYRINDRRRLVDVAIVRHRGDVYR